RKAQSEAFKRLYSRDEKAKRSVHYAMLWGVMVIAIVFFIAVTIAWVKLKTFPANYGLGLVLFICLGVVAFERAIKFNAELRAKYADQYAAEYVESERGKGRNKYTVITPRRLVTQ